MKATRTLTRGATALVLAGCLGMAPMATGALAAPGGGPDRGPVATAQPAATTLPVSGTLQDGSAFTGELSDLTTSVVDGVVQLSGTLSGTGLPADGVSFTAPVESLQVDDACTILTLDLGPINLDLLGLVVDLSEIELDVTAVPGAGNLLGNLLCAVAGLLDGPGNLLDGIAALLNRLLTGLGL